MFESSMLGAQYRRIKINKRSDIVFHGRHGYHLYSLYFIVVINIFVYAVPYFGGVLLGYAGVQTLTMGVGATVAARERFRQTAQPALG